MPLSNNAIILLKQRYCRKGESPADLFERVSGVLCNGDMKLGEQLEQAMIDGYFLPASPTLRNAGIKHSLMHPCHVLPLEDSIEGIMECLTNAAIIFHHGGGVGFNASNLRPKGNSLTLGGESSGVVSFLGLFNELTEIIKQGGFRRGAMMGVLNNDHPEILEFIAAKITGKLSNFNLSVCVTDDFMKKVVSDKIQKTKLKFNGKMYEEIKSDNIFDLMIMSAFLCGDPGILFYDRINEDNDSSHIINATNPCGEVPLPPYTACNLGSINLSKLVKNGQFDFNEYEIYVEMGMKVLKNINQLAWYPFDEMTENMRELDICGLGHFGLADALIMMSIYYDSTEALNFLDKLSVPYVYITNTIGKNSFYKRSQAPTGSLSIIANCSAGIEPIFERDFERHLTVGIIHEVRELYKSQYCQTAHEISPECHINIQAKIQSFTDAGVSKTINLPHDVSVDEVRKIYISAWKKDCKGVTIFRDGCKEGVLKKTTIKCEDGLCYL